MRLWHLVTLAALGVARDSVHAQDVSLMAQAIPVVTRADPTATRSALTEGYLSQPIVMAHAMWDWMRAAATLDLEGRTLQRGELSTGGYGEGYVDRRHPHAYVHELLAGAEGARGEVRGSVFVGRGFVPFGSDDPMSRPFEKYPVNHHLAQVLERVAAIGAIRYGPVIGEAATFNGDEPIAPGSRPAFDRVGDSWASRITVLPFDGAELSGSIARVKSPEVRAGAGLDQHKASIVARFSRQDNDSWRYAFVEWAHTNELDRGARAASLASVLGEAAVCRNGAMLAGRLERTDRPEEQALLDPFRVPRPSVDLSNLGISRWTLLTFSMSAPAATVAHVVARPFVEVERIAAAAGHPAGIFNPEIRYGASRMWMVSAGLRLRAGSMHARMGRYGAALTESGTHSPGAESHMMPGMSAAMPSDQHSSMAEHSNSRCSL